MVTIKEILEMQESFRRQLEPFSVQLKALQENSAQFQDDILTERPHLSATRSDPPKPQSFSCRRLSP
jgi:hypothetical protein